MPTEVPESIDLPDPVEAKNDGSVPLGAVTPREVQELSAAMGEHAKGVSFFDAVKNFWAVKALLERSDQKHG